MMNRIQGTKRTNRVVGLLIGIAGLLFGLPCLAAAPLDQGYVTPHVGVLCNQVEQTCYDDHGPSIGLTKEYLGQEAADALLEHLRKAPKPGALNVFRVGPGRYCVQQLAECMRNGQRDEALQQALFGSDDVTAKLRDILNRKWQWVETLMNNDDRFAPKAPENYTVMFMDEGQLAVLADCNGGGGSYAYSDGKLSYTGLFTTEMYCGDGSLDHTYLKQLQETDNFMLKDGELYLMLKYDSGVMHFRETPGE